MTEIAFVRHGVTEWNEAGRIQGRKDVALSTTGRAEVAAWQVPESLAGFRWISSPLRRAVETARLMGAPEPLDTDARLVEMDWGAWEGYTLPELRAMHGESMRRNEARGLDFRPTGGESPREVQARVADWLAEAAREGRPTLAVAHKGVIRATYALATGWDMLREPPEGLRRDALHLFRLDGGGRPSVDRLNLPLAPR